MALLAFLVRITSNRAVRTAAACLWAGAQLLQILSVRFFCARFAQPLLPLERGRLEIELQLG